MLNSDDTKQGRLARKLEFAIELAGTEEWASKSEIASKCKISRQAVNGWMKTGRVAKPHLVTIAALTRAPLEHFMADDDLWDWRKRHSTARELGAPYGMVVTQEEEALLLDLRELLPEKRAAFAADIHKQAQEARAYKAMGGHVVKTPEVTDIRTTEPTSPEPPRLDQHRLSTTPTKSTPKRRPGDAA